MVSPRIPPLYRALDFNSPLSDERADRLIRTLAPLAGLRVVDLGCGWAELLLRALAAEPAASSGARMLRRMAEGTGRPIRVPPGEVAPGGFEPPTPTLGEWCSVP